MSKWNMVVWVSVVLERSVVDSDWRFDNLCGCHLQSPRWKQDFWLWRWLPQRLSKHGLVTNRSCLSFLKLETQETRSRLNESAVSRKENLNKDQMPDKTDTTSKNYMLPFGNQGNFSRKQIVITRREMPSKHILDKHCNFQVNVHVYREMINFPKVTSCRQRLISALLTIKAESVKRYLSTIHERWRIQLQPKQFSRITYTSSRSVLYQKVHLDPDKDTLSFSLTKPTSKEKNTVVKGNFYLYFASFGCIRVSRTMACFCVVIAGLPHARSARGTEPHTHGMWSTSFRLVVTWLTERTYVRTRLQIRVG